MRNRGLLFLAVFLAAVAMLAGCGDSKDEIACEDVYICDATGTYLEACCGLTQCKYKVDGREFPCDGLDCDSAAEDAADYCSGVANSSADDVTRMLDTTTKIQRLLESE